MDQTSFYITVALILLVLILVIWYISDMRKKGRGKVTKKTKTGGGVTGVDESTGQKEHL